METFGTKVIRTDEYLIYIDENIWTKEAIAEWAQVFYPAETTGDIVKHLSLLIMRLGSDCGFIEGFGYVDNGKTQYKYGMEEVLEEEYAKGITIEIINENEEYDYELWEDPNN